jgi:porin
MKAIGGLRKMKRPKMPVAGRSLRVLALGGMLATGLGALPSAAWADCDVPANGIPEESFLTKLGPAWVSLGGLRPALAKGGIAVSGTYYGEAFVNSGGFNQGGKYDGVLDLALDIDMHKLGFWKGLCFHTNGFQIHGQSITATNIGSLMPVSSLEATNATRLFELWLEQHMFNDKLAVKVGQLAADTEFILSEGGGFFLNGTWGWPSISAADLPSGGPAYPLATPGVRVAITPSDKFQLLVGVYNGDPAPPCASDDPQVCNNDGLDFELDDPPLLMVEGAYKYNQDRLAGTIKVGGWNHFGDFEHQRFDVGGNVIAVSGLPGRPIDNNYGI